MSKAPSTKPGPILHAKTGSALGHLSILLGLVRKWQQAHTDWNMSTSVAPDEKCCINFIWEGSGAFRHGYKERAFSAPCCYVRFAKEEHGLRFNQGQMRESWVVISGTVASILSAGLQIDKTRSLIHLENVSLIQRRLNDLARVMRSDGELVAFGEVLARLQLLCAGLWCGNQTISQSEDDLERVRIAVQAEPSKNWRVEDLAKLCACQPDALRQRFHRRLACGPTDYVCRLKMQMAQKLLGTLLIKQIATHLGYSDHRSFGRQFKRHFGMGAHEFAKLMEA